MEMLDELKALQRSRKDGMPFSSLIEFEDWADSVLPFLSYHQPYETEFNQAVTGATVTYRMEDYQDSSTCMNNAIGILNKAVKKMELDSRLQEIPQVGFEDLLHPAIVASSLNLYVNGHLRESVLNSITAIFDLIRQRTGVMEDGDRLIGQVFSINDPVLILSELKSESGQNDQKGFMQIYKGAYQGIRNPKAHTLNHDLNEMKAAQYLVFASMLARRIDEASNA
ncbi:hypothetical protein GCM10009098_03450 [Rheinheimera aquimaris]|uniref:Conserved hypothetical protein CHP02391 domain-containing protein n=2 Tax=Rheinheimera aquimaris TaxID=412437 RepID=A0ABN1DCJ6_9GAMM